MSDDPPRTRAARAAAERALIRIVLHYGAANALGLIVAQHVEPQPSAA